jgi:nucleoside-diphosphate-sugar epimerase
MIKEKVLITGGAGYIGSVLTDQLLKENYKVTCLDNLKYGQKAYSIYASNPNFDFIFGDVRNEGLLNKIAKNFDSIIPLAAIVGAPACDNNPLEATSTNFEAIKLLNNLRSQDQKFIYPNTTSGYGGKDGREFCTEETPMEPISLYGITKLNAENCIKESGKDYVCPRLSTVFGTSLRMRSDLLVNDFVLRAVRDGFIVLFEKDFKRDYVHIRDVARAFQYCMENYDRMKNQSYNIGLDEANLSKYELAKKIKQHIPKFTIMTSDIGQDPDKRNYQVSNKKIKDAGFKFKVSLDEGINELIKGYDILLRNDPTKNI